MFRETMKCTNTILKWLGRSQIGPTLSQITWKNKKALPDKLRYFCKANFSSTSDNEEAGKSVLYEKQGRVAYVTLNRPKQLNAIDVNMPGQLEEAVKMANDDDDVRVILLSGNGKAFCSGYDLKQFAEGNRGEIPGSQTMPWDPYIDYKLMSAFTFSFMTLWRSFKPVVCKIHGYAVAGGSDIALSCDICIMADNAKIGYTPARVWGCPTTAMWVYRIGAEKAKKMLFTGDLITGIEAAKMGLVCESVPSKRLTERTNELVQRISSVPSNQLFMQKQVINSAVEQMGLFQTQRLATLFDGMARHTPEGVEFQDNVRKFGFKKAVHERDRDDKES